MTRVWRIWGHVVFPAVMPMGVGGALPEHAAAVDRLGEPQGAVVDGLRLRLAASLQAPTVGGQLADLRCDIEAVEAMAALEAASPTIALVLDDLTFQVQAPIRFVNVEVVDVTPPASVGDVRELLHVVDSYNYPYTISTVQMAGVGAATVRPTIRQLPPMRPSLRAGLMWYAKALGTPSSIDRFMLLCVALELLVKAADMPPSGNSLRAFLVERHSFTAEEAATVWELRQAMHGDVSAASHLPASLPALEAAVGSELKQRLGVEPTQPPHFNPHPVGIAGVYLGGSRQLVASDIA